MSVYRNKRFYLPDLWVNARLQWRGWDGEWAFGFYFRPVFGLGIELGPLGLSAAFCDFDYLSVGWQVSHVPGSWWAVSLYAFGRTLDWEWG